MMLTTGKYQLHTGLKLLGENDYEGMHIAYPQSKISISFQTQLSLFKTQCNPEDSYIRSYVTNFCFNWTTSLYLNSEFWQSSV